MRAARFGGRTPYLLMLPAVVWLAVFFVVPMVQLLAVSLQSPYPGRPGYYVSDVNVGNYAVALTQFGAHFGRSILYAGAATVLAAVLAYPVAYLIAFRAGRWRAVLLVCVVAPFFTSFVLRTIAWRQILADDSLVATLLRTLHLLPGGHITETAGAVIAGLAYNYLPFMILPLYASLERVDRSLVEAGHDLYGGGPATFAHVTFPLALPGLLGGTLMTFIPAAGDYVNADLLGSDVSTKMVGNVIDSQFFKVLGGYPTAAALSVVLMALVLALVTVYARRFGTEDLL